MSDSCPVLANNRRRTASMQTPGRPSKRSVSAIPLHSATVVLVMFGMGATWFGAKLLGAEALLWSQMFWALAIQRRLSGRIVVYDLRVAFIVVYTLYGGAVGLSTLWGLGDLQGLTASDPGLTLAVMYYAIGSCAYNVVQLVYRRPWVELPPPRGVARRTAQPIVIVLSLAFLAWFVYSLINTGIRIRYDVNREMHDTVVTQTWVVAVFLMQGFWMYCLYEWHRFGRKTQLLLGAVLLATALYFILAAGARRDMLTIAIFGAVVFLARRRSALNYKVICVIVLGLVLNLWIGVVRESGDGSRDWREEVQLALGNNEFSIPAQNLVIYIESHEWKLRYGTTYLRWPEYFVPRAWWRGKPKALAWETFEDTGRSVPTYTPVVEAYVNFLWVGPPLMIGVFSALFTWLVASARKTPVIYLMVVSLVFDFNRGEFGLTIYSLVFIYSGYWLARICSIRRNRGYVRPMSVAISTAGVK